MKITNYFRDVELLLCPVDKYVGVLIKIKVYLRTAGRKCFTIQIKLLFLTFMKTKKEDEN